jgi:hypothetical protein
MKNPQPQWANNPAIVPKPSGDPTLPRHAQLLHGSPVQLFLSKNGVPIPRPSSLLSPPPPLYIQLLATYIDTLIPFLNTLLLATWRNETPLFVSVWPSVSTMTCPCFISGGGL